MSRSKLSRWRCPHCSEGKLAPSRPRRDDVRKYCIPCSERTGRLVERVNPARENVRAKRAEVARAKRRRTHTFKAPPGYYMIAGCCIRALWRSRNGERFDNEIRVRTTMRAGPVSIKDGIVTFRKGPWADEYDARAQAAVGIIRKHRGGDEAYLRICIRDYIQQSYGVRPRLDSLRNAEIEVAALLRAKAAASMLGTLDRKSA